MENILKNLNTKIIGKNLIILEEVDSTQMYIKDIAANSPDGLVVIAKNQTAGIGTNGRIWHTEKDKNLTFSILLKPECNVSKIEKLTILLAEAIVDVIKQKYGYDLNIKYPNDIILNSKKLGGILTEALVLKDKVNQIIIGIGLNINQEEFYGEIKNIATSLKKEFEKDFDKFEILGNILNEIERVYMKIL